MRKPIFAAGLLAATLAGSAYAQQPPSPPGGPQPNAPAPGGAGGATPSQPGAPSAAPGLIIVEGPPQGAQGGASGGPGQPALMGPGAGGVVANPLAMGGPAAERAMQEQMMREQMAHGGPQHGMQRPMMMGGRGGYDREEGGEDEMAMMRMHLPKGAVFVFRNGPQRVIVKCADDEATKACVDGATALFGAITGGGSVGAGNQGGSTPGSSGGGTTQ